MSAYSDYELMRYLPLRPRMFFGEAESLRDVLVLIHGVALGRYPPHGSKFLPGFTTISSVVSMLLAANPTRYFWSNLATCRGLRGVRRWWPCWRNGRRRRTRHEAETKQRLLLVLPQKLSRRRAAGRRSRLGLHLRRMHIPMSGHH
jgi:hypothetical protein